MPPRRQLHVPRPARRADCGDGDVGRVVSVERGRAVLIRGVRHPAATAVQPPSDAAEQAQPARRRNLRDGSDGLGGRPDPHRIAVLLVAAAAAQELDQPSFKTIAKKPSLASPQKPLTEVRITVAASSLQSRGSARVRYFVLNNHRQFF